MIVDFILKKVNNAYNLTLIKEVKKRNGSIAKEQGDTLYTISLDLVKNILSHIKTQSKLDNDISLQEYIFEYNKSYKEVCELLKKIL